MKLVVGLAIVFAAATAHAQPSLVEASPALEPPVLPTTYVSLGGAIGADQGGEYLNPSFELGHRLRGSLWSHGMIEGGDDLAVEERTVSGARFVVRAGVEERTCAWNEAVCLVGGLDLGYRKERFDAETFMSTVEGVAAFERIGLDVGTRTLRFRPAFELTSSASKGVRDGTGMTVNVAYAW